MTYEATHNLRINYSSRNNMTKKEWKQPWLESYLAPPLESLRWCSAMLGTTRDSLTKFGMLDSYGNINLVYTTLDHYLIS